LLAWQSARIQKEAEVGSKPTSGNQQSEVPSRRDFLKRAGGAGAALLAGPSLMSIIESCGGGTAGNPNPQATVNFSKGGEIHLLQWQNFVPEADVKMQELMTRWAGQHSGWKAVLDRVSANDLQGKVSAAVQAQSGPDIFQLEYNWPWLYANALLDVSDVVNRLIAKQGKFYDEMTNNSKVSGKWLAVPFCYNSNTWVYRKDLWTQIGKPTFVPTYDELLTYGKQLKDKTGIPVGEALGHAFGDGTAMWYSTLWAFGGKEVQQDGKTVAINSKETEAALNWAVEMWRGVLDQTGLSWDDTSNNRAWAAKKLTATINGSSIYISTLPGHNAADPFLQQNTVSSPPLKGPSGQSPMLQGTWEHGVAKWSPNPGAAKDMIEYLMEKDVYAEWLTASAGYASYPNALFDNASVWSDPVLKTYNDGIKFGRWPGWPGPPSKQSSRVQTSYIIVDMFAKAVQNPDQVKKILSDTEGQLTSIYGAPA
jgi:multiple sugar transport system substrate-binding protein